MAKDPRLSTRNLKADAKNCVDCAKDIGVPIETMLDCFEGEPLALLINIAKRLKELAAESADSGEDDFDPVQYVTGAAQSRGWGVYRQPEVTEEVTEEEVSKATESDEVVSVDLSPIEDDETFQRVAQLFDHHKEELIGFLCRIVAMPDVKENLDMEINGVPAASQQDQGGEE